MFARTPAYVAVPGTTHRKPTQDDTVVNALAVELRDITEIIATSALLSLYNVVVGVLAMMEIGFYVALSVVAWKVLLIIPVVISIVYLLAVTFARKRRDVLKKRLGTFLAHAFATTLWSGMAFLIVLILSELYSGTELAFFDAHRWASVPPKEVDIRIYIHWYMAMLLVIINALREVDHQLANFAPNLGQ